MNMIKPWESQNGAHPQDSLEQLQVTSYNANIQILISSNRDTKEPDTHKEDLGLKTVKVNYGTTAKNLIIEVVDCRLKHTKFTISIGDTKKKQLFK